MASFRDAYASASWQVPNLMLHADVWINDLLPFLRRHPYGSKYAELADLNEAGLRTGWLLGEDNPNRAQLNQREYDPRAAGSDGFVAIAEAFTADLRKGRHSAWFGEDLGKVPLFVGVKSRCPLTDFAIAWRVIRDVSCGSALFRSLNSLTHDEDATIELINKRTVLSYVYIMYVLYGPGVLLGKADLAGAFRQFYLAIGEPQKILYTFDGKLIADFCNIWGSRTGARICHHMTQCSARDFALRVNGVHLLDDINKAIEEADVVYFEHKMQMSVVVPVLPDEVVPYTPKMSQACPLRFESPDSSQIWRWSASAVGAWLDEQHMFHEVDDILDLQNGIHLMRCHRDYVQLHHGEQAVRALEGVRFFDKLIELKLCSNQLLKLLINCYIDDYLAFMAPQTTFATDTLSALSARFVDTGFLENEEKQEGPVTSLIQLGIQPDTVAMTVRHPEHKRKQVLELVYKVLFHGGCTVRTHESLLGKLENLAEYAWPGRAFIRRIRTQNTLLIKKYGHKSDVWVELPDWECKDLRWWAEFGETVTTVSIQHMLDSTLPERQIFFDGATNGARPSWRPRLGVYFEGTYISMPVPPHMCHVFVSDIDGTPKDFAIAQFEALAIVVGLHNLRDRIGTHCKLLMRTDSKHVEAAILNKSTPDPFLMACVRWVMMYAVRRRLRLHILYVHTDDNTFADGASRLSLIGHNEWMQEAQRECVQRGWEFREHLNPTIPDLTRW